MEKRNIKEVRKNISKRKQQKRAQIVQAKIPYELPQEEEKHGYFPFSSSNSFGKKDGSFQVPAIMFKILLSAILFFATAIVLRTDLTALEKPKNWLYQAFTEEFNFAKVQGWYRENLGSPFAFLNDQKNVEHVTQDGFVLPVDGSISASFQETGKGVFIEVDDVKDMSVGAMRAGTVTFAGNKKDTGKTVMIQHEDRSYSIYGNLHELDVFPYQFVSKNDVIGTLKPEDNSKTASLYFAVKENQTFVDPIKVIQVDDQN